MSKLPKETPQLSLLKAMPHLTLRLNRLGICLAVRADQPSLEADWQIALGQTLQDLLPIELAEPSLRQVEAALDTHKLQCFEQWLLLEGIYYHWEVLILIVNQAEVLLTVRDVTDRSQSELALLKANEELEEALQLQAADLLATQAQLQQETQSHRQTEAVLRENWRRHHLVMNHLKEVVFQRDLEGRWVSLNPAWTMITGFGLEETLDQLFETWLHPDDAAQERQAFRQLLQGHITQYNTSGRYRTKTGEFRWLETSAQILRGSIGEAIGVIGTLEDVTKRKQAELSLQQEIEREQLLGTIAHRVRQSLNLQETLQTAVTEVQQFLQTDRVVLYEFQPDWSGRIMVEAVSATWSPLLDEVIKDTCFIGQNSPYIEYYRQGHTRSIDDIHQAGLSDCHVALLSQRQVRANLVVPVFQGEQLWGLLIAHHCRSTRCWQTWEVSLLERLSVQIGIAVEQASLYAKLKQELQERQQTQQQLHLVLGELEAQKSALDQAVMVAMIDDRGILTYVNDQYCQVSQYSLDELFGQRHRHFFDSGQPQLLYDALWQTISEGQIWRGEVQNQAKDGSFYWVDATIVPYLGADGVPIQHLVICLDITPQRIAQTQLRAIQKRLQYVLSSSPAILYTCKPHSQRMLTFISTNVDALLGWRAHQFLTSRNLWLDLVHPEDVEQVLASLAKLPTQDHLTLEYRFKHQDGSYHWLRDEVKLVLNDQGQPLEYIGSIIDISDRKQAESEVLRALAKEKELHEMKSRFVSQTSHEFRTPLATIFASSDLLKRFGHKLSDQQKQDRLEKIQAEVKHMTRLLEDVLILGKAEAGYLECNPLPLDLERLCKEVLAEIEMIKAPSHQLIFNHQGDCQLINADEILLRQILVNLLSNAVKYSPNGGKIYLHLTNNDHQVVLQVQDEGMGIALVEQAHLFEDFYRASNVSNLPGTGLGLAIVKRAVDLHGGSITVQSELDQGSTFTVCLPINLGPSEGGRR